MKTIKVLPNLDAVNSEFRRLIQENYDNCKERFFTIGLSDGQLIACLTTVLPTLQVDWKKDRFFFCDERIGPFDHPLATFGSYWKALEGVIPVEKDQFIGIDGLRGDEVAEKYAQRIGEIANVDQDGFPVFNVILLGVDSNGVPASLPPVNIASTMRTKEWVHKSNKSVDLICKPGRITLTLPVINSAETVIFVVTGGSKNQILAEILVPDPGCERRLDYPARRVNPKKGELFWLVDEDASRWLPVSMGGKWIGMGQDSAENFDQIFVGQNILKAKEV